MCGRGAVVPAIAIWLGLLAGAAGGPWSIAVSAATAVVLAWLGCRAGPRFGAVLLAAACFAAAMSRGAAHGRALDAGEAAFASTTSACWVRGVVADHPWVESGEPSAIVRVFAVEGFSVPAGTRVRLWLPADATVEWGDPIEALARLQPPAGRRVPGGYDARAAARAQGWVAQGRALAVRAEPAAGVPRATLVRWRRGVEAIFRGGLSSEAREIVTPLVIGDRSGVGAELAAGFQAAGLTHLLALSGLHVVWMAAVARVAIGLLGGGVAARGWAGAMCAALYLGVAGPLPSLARAAVTEAIAAWGVIRDRATDAVQALAAGAALLLAIAPGWASDLGFQLSCAATAGLVTIGAEPRERARSWTGRSWELLRRVATPTLAAQAAALPLLLARFHALPWTSLGANLLAVPVCELALAAAWLGAILEAIAPGSARACFAACEAATAALRGIVASASSAPVPLWPTGDLAALPWLAAFGATLLALGGARSRTVVARSAASPARERAGAAGGLALALSVMLAATARPLAPPPDRWWLVALDVGQGDAIALGFGGAWWLVDAGPSSPRHDAGRSAILPFLRWLGVRSLDTVVLTHAHADHTGGAGAVLSSIPADRLALREGMRPPPSCGARRTSFVGAGDTLRAERPAVLVRWPPRARPEANENAASIVLEVGGGALRVLLAADVDSTIEAALARPVAVLKVAHHGARSSSGAVALAVMRPGVAIVSCGRSNPFGHPDEGALARLRASGSDVRRTDREGTVWLEIGPERVTRYDWRSGASARRANAIAPAPNAPRTLAGAPARW